MGFDLKGVRVIVTAGPTREMWDSVRYLSNLSSGTMGFAISSEALRRGAEVTLISSVNPPPGSATCFCRISSAEEMFSAVKKHYPGSSIFVSAAAVADFRPVRSPSKIRKKNGLPSIMLERTPDILRWAGSCREDRVLAGFSLGDRIDPVEARAKMREKNCQVMVANTVENLGSPRKSFVIFYGGRQEEFRDISAGESAVVILEKCAAALRAG